MRLSECLRSRAPTLSARVIGAPLHDAKLMLLLCQQHLRPPARSEEGIAASEVGEAGLAEKFRDS